MRTVIVFLFFIALPPVPTLQGQSLPLVAPGDRVRLIARQAQGEFTVVSRDNEELTVRRSDEATPITLGVDELSSLSVDRGLRSRWSGANRGGIIGAVTGGAAGIVAGLVDGDDRCGSGEWCLFEMSAGEKAVLGGMALGAAGGVIGAAIGGLFPGRRWETVTLPIRAGLRPAAGGGLGLTAAIRF
jgi:hypothetical protein